MAPSNVAGRHPRECAPDTPGMNPGRAASLSTPDFSVCSQTSHDWQASSGIGESNLGLVLTCRSVPSFQLLLQSFRPFMLMDWNCRMGATPRTGAEIGYRLLVLFLGSHPPSGSSLTWRSSPIAPVGAACMHTSCWLFPKTSACNSHRVS